MRNLIYGLLIILSLGSCSKEKVGYTISGSWDNGEGEKVFLGYVDKQTRQFDIIDSAVVADGQYAMSGELSDFGDATIKTAYGQRNIFLCDEPFRLDLKVNEVKISEAKSIKRMVFDVSESREQELFNNFSDASMVGLMGVLAVGMNMQKAKESGDKALQDSLVKMYVLAIEKERAIKDSLFANFKDSYIAAMVIEKSYLKDKTYDELNADMQSLSPRVINSYMGKMLEEKIALIKDVSKGSVAPSFELFNTDGTLISLDDYKGKYLLIDFWASWCAPCIKEMPNIKRLYAKYNNLGFEVLSISLDEDKAKWEKAIADNNLNWAQVSSLKGWNCKVAKRYNVKSVPKLCLIDKDGVILLDDVHGEDLESELSKIFGDK